MREELFGVDRLEKHAESLAAAQGVTTTPPRVLSLHTRVKDNAKALLKAYRASALELESGRGVVPAVEWLLDNYHLVEAQISEIRDDLPPGFGGGEDLVGDEEDGLGEVEGSALGRGLHGRKDRAGPSNSAHASCFARWLGATINT